VKLNPGIFRESNHWLNQERDDGFAKHSAINQVQKLRKLRPTGVTAMPSSQRSTFQTVVFATDFSVFSQNAGLYASLLARQYGAYLLVSHAFYLSQASLEVEVMSEVRSMQRQDLEAYLARRVERLGGGNFQSKAVLVEGDPREEILRIAERNPAPIIVMGTHGGTLIERGLLGSTAESILRNTRYPCFTVGPRVRALTPKSSPFRRILYATELHPAVASAATIAVAFAEEFHAKIDVLHVVPPNKIPDVLTKSRRSSIRLSTNWFLCKPRSFPLRQASSKLATRTFRFSGILRSTASICWCSGFARVRRFGPDRGSPERFISSPSPHAR
jgi:nucleotide-binding universal stress UspA family protein